MKSCFLFPNAISRFSLPVHIAVMAVWNAGRVAQAADRGGKTKQGEGHRSIVTQGDQKAEKVLVDCILGAFPEARILSEEDADNSNMLKKDRPDGLMEAELAFIIDPVDGTAPYGSYLGTWCVSAGVMKNGMLIGSAVYAPDLNGGMLLVAEEGKGTIVIDGALDSVREIAPPETSTAPKKATVFRGVDSDLYEVMIRRIPEIAMNVRVTGVANSGILALAQVASGRITAVIQTPQKAWDWAGAYRAVLEAGRIFSFFRLVPDPTASGADMLVEGGVNAYDFDAFCYDKGNRLGFVAGEPAMVRRLMKVMPRTGWSRTNPENVSGAWQ